VEYFVSDRPDPALVAKLSQKFLATGGDIRAVLQTLFDSPQFWARSNYQTQFKTPYQFMVSALRAGDITVRNAKPVNGELGQSGMPLYGWLTPEGYKYSEAAWLNPGRCCGGSTWRATWPAASRRLRGPKDARPFQCRGAAAGSATIAAHAGTGDHATGQRPDQRRAG
jgi:uncharacterized protein (DUF1800 family)